MASHPPARCCVVGFKHEGKAQGEIKQIGGITSYVAYPEDKSTDLCILIMPDVLGHEYINIQLVADQFATYGYFVVMPDLFDGDPVPREWPEGFTFAKWSENGRGGKGHKSDQVDPICEKVIKDLKTTYKVKKIGSVGYCFGAKYVARFLAEGKGVDVGAFAHPSWVEADELSNIAGPLTIAAAETDGIFPPEKRHESEQILMKKDVPWQINLYSDVMHGFAIRGDPSNPRIKYAKEAAFLQHLQWFDHFLRGEEAS